LGAGRAGAGEGTDSGSGLECLSLKSRAPSALTVLGDQWKGMTFMITAIYDPPVEGLPVLAVVIDKDGLFDVTPFPTRDEAEAYIEVCNVGMAGDLIRKQGSLNA
jgi:hypothetical protein